jgi:signal transduction histidine kinase
VSLHFTERSVILVVQDNGGGMPHTSFVSVRTAGHFGLRSMRRRAEAVGGELSWYNGEDGGFVVRAVIPAEPRWAEQV